MLTSVIALPLDHQHDKFQSLIPGVVLKFRGEHVCFSGEDVCFYGEDVCFYGEDVCFYGEDVDVTEKACCYSRKL